MITCDKTFFQAEEEIIRLKNRFDNFISRIDDLLGDKNFPSESTGRQRIMETKRYLMLMRTIVKDYRELFKYIDELREVFSAGIYDLSNLMRRLDKYAPRMDVPGVGSAGYLYSAADSIKDNAIKMAHPVYPENELTTNEVLAICGNVYTVINDIIPFMMHAISCAENEDLRAFKNAYRFLNAYNSIDLISKKLKSVNLDCYDDFVAKANSMLKEEDFYLDEANHIFVAKRVRLRKLTKEALDKYPKDQRDLIKDYKSHRIVACRFVIHK